MSRCRESVEAGDVIMHGGDDCWVQPCCDGIPRTITSLTAFQQFELPYGNLGTLARVFDESAGCDRVSPTKGAFAYDRLQTGCPWQGWKVSILRFLRRIKLLQACNRGGDSPWQVISSPPKG
jgi:hypothetical protein